MRCTSRSLIMALMVFLTMGCAGHLVYESGPYRGKVIDAGTKEPLVGAVVLAIWYREVPVAPHGPAVDYHDALEVLTDALGEFTVPAKTHFTPLGRIVEPAFVIYSPGYGYYPVYQVRPTGEEAEKIRHESTVVELPRWKTVDERKRLRDLPVWTSKVPGAKMPNLIHQANEEGRDIGITTVYGKEKSK